MKSDDKNVGGEAVVCKELLGDSELTRLVNEVNRLRHALETISYAIEQHPLLNEEIAQQVMNDDFSLAVSIGGDEANISEWAGIIRKALSANSGAKRRAHETTDNKNL
jgi:hypothetical protein